MKALLDAFYGKKPYIGYIEFDGMKYPVRILTDCEGNDIMTISTTDLLDAIHPGEWDDENEGWVNKEAELVDEMVYYYHDSNRDLYTLSDYDLKCELCEGGLEPCDAFSPDELLVYYETHPERKPN